MVLNIKSDEADRLARELARRRQKSLTTVIVDALRADLARKILECARPPGMADRLMKIGERYARLAGRDTRTDDEILGYDERGLPG